MKKADLYARIDFEPTTNYKEQWKLVEFSKLTADLGKNQHFE